MRWDSKVKLMGPKVWDLCLIILILLTSSRCVQLSARMSEACPELEKANYPAGLLIDQRDRFIANEIRTQNFTVHERCAAELVEAGLTLSAGVALSILLEQAIFTDKHRADMAVAIQRRQSQLEALIKLSVLTGNKVEARPAMKWGQSFEEVTMFLKFASRIDSPGCNDVTEQSEAIRTLDGSTHLSIGGLCVLAGRPVRFVLDLPLYEDVQPNGLKVVTAGVGAVIITLKKRRVGIWPQIWKKGFNKKGYPITIWWDLSGSQFEKGMRAFRKLRQELDEEDSEGLWRDNPRRSGAVSESSTILDRMARGLVGIWRQLVHFLW
jgi:hypothetical protein